MLEKWLEGLQFFQDESTNPLAELEALKGLAQSPGWSILQSELRRLAFRHNLNLIRGSEDSDFERAAVAIYGRIADYPIIRVVELEKLVQQQESKSERSRSTVARHTGR